VRSMLVGWSGVKQRNLNNGEDSGYAVHFRCRIMVSLVFPQRFSMHMCGIITADFTT
jgi:hypothetical protein